MRRTVAALSVLTVLLAGCGNDAGEATDTDEPGAAGESGTGPHVVTPVFALASLTAQLAPGADVELLGGAGQDPHDLELSPSERAAIEDADIVAYMGDLGFQPQVERAVAGATGRVVSVAEVLGRDTLRELDPGRDDGHADVDPHVWLAPVLLDEVVDELGAALASVDAEHAGDYDAAAAALADELAAAEDRIDAQLSDCAQPTALVGHEAWGYLFASRAPSQEGISGAGGHGEASPQRLGELADLIVERDIPGVFAEPVEGRRDAEALAAEAGVRLYEVDPLESPADVDDWMARGYLDLLDAQVATFAEGLQCRG